MPEKRKRSRMPIFQTWTLNPHAEPQPHRSPTTVFHGLNANSPLHDKIYLRAFTPRDFSFAPFHAVQTLLSQPSLSIPEDDVLQALLQYCSNLESELHVSSASSSVTLKLLNHIRPLSLSNAVYIQRFLSIHQNDSLQPLKFRYDAICRSLNVRHLWYIDIRKYFPDHLERTTLLGAFRPNTMIRESKHPTLSHTCEIRGPPWTPRMSLEFDRRTVITPDVSFTLALDTVGTEAVEWSTLWRRRGKGNESATQGVKTIVWEASTVVITLQVPATATPLWGWKLLVTPLICDDD